MLEAIVFFRCKITDNITDHKKILSKFFRCGSEDWIKKFGISLYTYL